MGNILPFKAPVPSRLPPSCRPTPELNVCLKAILCEMAHSANREETKRLFKVQVNALYALNIIDEKEWAVILNALKSVPYYRRLP